MCIIALDNRVGSTERIPVDVLRRCREKYPHGLGIMFAKGGRLHTWRSMDDMEGLWNRYTTARDEGRRVALHFRYTTQGDNVVANCHPFRAGREFGFMHNGTILGLKDLLPKGMSDTQYLAKEIIPRLPGDFLSHPGMVAMLESLMSGDRLLFMDGDDNYSIVNEKTGFWEFYDRYDNRWEEGVWFSHTRDRQYLIKGKEWSYGGRSYGTGAGDRHRDYRAASSKWNRSGSAGTGGEEDSGEAGKSTQLTAVRRPTSSGVSTNLLFDVGHLKPSRGFSALGMATLPGAALYAVHTMDDQPRPFINMDGGKHRVYGTLYSLDARHPGSIISAISQMGRGWERRNLLVDMSDGSGSIHAWVFTRKLTDELHDGGVVRVADGNWLSWYAGYREAVDGDDDAAPRSGVIIPPALQRTLDVDGAGLSLSTIEEADDEDERDGDDEPVPVDVLLGDGSYITACPECGKYETQVFSVASDRYLWCWDCETESDYDEEEGVFA